MAGNDRSRANISFDSKEELDELRLRTTYLGYTSMGAFISDQLNLKDSMFDVSSDLQRVKKEKEKDDV